jgi:hypothetical protein
MTGKISRLPETIRSQLNHRLANGQGADLILPWLNSLPEVKAALDADFSGQPISDQNLSEYRKRGFRRWEMHQSAREFSSELASAETAAAGQSSSVPLVDNLVQWISLRFAAAAQSSTFAEDADTELRQIRQFLADIVALRRGDLVARRIHLEQRRLTLEETKNEQTLEKLFWEWTQRPDIRAQLYPHQDPDKMRHDVVRLLDRHLLGVRDQSSHASDPDPAAFI